MKFEKLRKVRSLNNGLERSKPANFYASLRAKEIERVCPLFAEARLYPSEHRNNQVKQFTLRFLSMRKRVKTFEKCDRVPKLVI